MSTSLQDKFVAFLGKSIDAQVEFFLKSFIFELGDDWKEVGALAKAYKAKLVEAGEKKKDLNHIQAAAFLQENGQTRTGLERKRECKDIDIDANGRISFIEYLLLHYKVMILQAYYKRHKKPVAEDLSRGGAGVVGVGSKLVEELFHIPLNLDPAIVEALEQLTKKKKAREKKISKLTKKVAKGGVAGKAAQAELDQLMSQDGTEINRIEVTLKAARKKNLKTAKTASRALAAEKTIVEKAKKAERKKKRDAFAARAAMFQ